jgi:hypothetical protein
MQNRRILGNTQGRSKVKRWYRGFSYRGNPSELVEQISKKIQEFKLARFLPLLRLEKGAKRNKVFYFFIAIESETLGIISSQIESTNIFQLPFFRTPAVKGYTHFTYEQIKGMVGNAHDVTDYTNPIPYRSQPKIISESSLNLLDSNQTQPIDHERINSLSKTYEHFLYWLSAVGSGTWESFKKTCEILELAEPKRILRRLKLLGHITTSNNGSKWRVNPPSLLEIQSENGDRTFILHGQRSGKFLNTLRTFGSLETCNQPRGEAPPCIRFRLPSQISYETLTQRLQAQGYSITLTPVKNIPDIATWYRELSAVQGLLPYNFRLKRFDGDDFIDCTFQKETGFYQFFSQDMNTHPQYTFFYDADRNQWVQGDWYGLRFWAIHQINREKLCACYSEGERKLLIPFSKRWAEVYETYLVMSSGLLPSYARDTLIYEGVSSDLTNELSQKLDISI